MDAIRDKQEKIAKNHFEQDMRLTESKYVILKYKYLKIIFVIKFTTIMFTKRFEGEDRKAQSMRDLEELTRQVNY